MNHLNTDSYVDIINKQSNIKQTPKYNKNDVNIQNIEVKDSDLVSNATPEFQNVELKNKPNDGKGHITAKEKLPVQTNNNTSSKNNFTVEKELISNTRFEGTESENTNKNNRNLENGQERSSIDAKGKGKLLKKDDKKCCFVL